MAVVAAGEMTVNPDLSGFESKATGAFGNIAKKAAVAFGGIFAAQKGLDFFQDAVGGASDLQESLGKVGVVFGPMAGEIEKFASNSAKAFGQSKQQALEAAGTFGNLAVSLGVPVGKATEMSKSMVTLAADLASFNNTSVDDALLALRSGLSGETEPLKRFGIALDDATLKQKALELGLTKTTTGTLPPAIKAQAAYALIMDRSKTAQGDFARTSGGLANQQRILAAQMTDLKTKVGSALIPIVTKVTSFLVTKMIPAFENIGRAVKPVIEGIKMFVNSFRTGFTEDEGTRVEGIALTFREKFLPVLQKVIAAVRDLITFVQTNLPKFQETFEHVINAVMAVFNQMQGTISIVLDTVRFVFENTIGKIITIIRELVLFVTNIINGDFSAAFGNLQTIVKTAVSGVIELLMGLPSRIAGIAVGIVSAMASLGRDILAGLISGIKDKAGDVLGAIKRFVLDKVPGFVKKFFGIGSPSKMFAGFGGNLMDGLAQGIRNSSGSPLNALSRVQGAMGVGGGIGVAFAGSGGGNVFNVAVNFQGATSEEQAYTVGRAVGRGAAYEMERAEARRSARVA